MEQIRMRLEQAPRIIIEKDAQQILIELMAQAIIDVLTCKENCDDEEL